MIKALAHRNGRPLLILGLSRKNCKHLLRGEPIHIASEEVDIPYGMDIVIMGGNTEQSIADEILKNAAGVDEIRDERNKPGH